MKKTILITAGGTGGHIFPALAVAKLLQANYDLVWVGAARGIENEIVPANKILLETINIYGLRHKGLLKLVLMPIILCQAFFQALKILLRYRPDVIVGFGGYATFPICFMGWLLRLPLLIHEQNSVPGLTNRLLAKCATKVMVAFTGVLTTAKTLVVGNPVRQEILELLPPEQRYANRSGGLNILVLGGSLGAKILNETLPAVFAQFPNLSSVVHQVGRGDAQMVQQQYDKVNVPAKVVNFIDDMAYAYANADLVICRAGASTVSEICAVGIAAIFIPYPYAVDDHQRFNVEPLAKLDAAKMLLQSQCNTLALVELLQSLDRESCLAMAKKANSLAIGDSSQRICELIIQSIPV